MIINAKSTSNVAILHSTNNQIKLQYTGHSTLTAIDYLLNGDTALSLQFNFSPYTYPSVILYLLLKASRFGRLTDLIPLQV